MLISLWPRRAQRFFFNNATTTEIYTLSLHDALPIWKSSSSCGGSGPLASAGAAPLQAAAPAQDRKSTRLNSSHLGNSYAVFCLKKKKSQGGRRKGTKKTKGTKGTRGQERDGVTE